MMLSDFHLEMALEFGRIKIEPFEPSLMQPASIDVRLDNAFRAYNSARYTHIDPSIEQPDLTTLVEMPDATPYLLHPGEFVLGCTVETITLPNDLCARLEGRSSLGRLGLLVHSTAGFIDPGFHGQVTLELSNACTLPIALWPGSVIGQLCVFQLSGRSSRSYGDKLSGSHYQGQRGPTPSRSWQNFRRWPTTPAG